MTRSKPLTSEEFRSIYAKVPRLGIDVIVTTDTGIVLTKRSLPTWHGRWHIPGSGLLFRESVHDAAKRIAQEELGVEVGDIRMIGYIEYISSEKERGFGHDVSIVLRCRYVSGAFFEATEEASEIAQFPAMPEGMIEEQAAFLQTHHDQVFTM